MVPDRVVLVQEDPAAEAYWTVQPVTLTGVVPRLYSSTKSLVYGAPELPPPPYTWLMTRSGDTACAVPAGSAVSAPTTVAADATASARSRTRSVRRMGVLLTGVQQWMGGRCVL
ncbi:hypothetical protein VR45_30515 [Streptomyces sp. NRRL S-495]|nr:hypothetical protein VR45_30515 [Streptomyces sp. NRRL S-495]